MRLFFLLSFLPLLLPAQTAPRFLNLGLEDGLAQGTINDIAQDQQGYMWFATQDGLHRFDGYDFSIYRYDAKDTSSITDGYVNNLETDSKGELFIGTLSGGLNYYQAETNTFSAYQSQEDNPKSISGNGIEEIAFQCDSLLWVSSIDGICRLNRNTQTFDHFPPDPNDPQADRKMAALCMHHTGGNEILLGYPGQGLEKLDIENRTYQAYSIIYAPDSTDRIANLKANIVRVILEDEEGDIWLGTHAGLYRIPKGKTKAEYIPVFPDAIDRIVIDIKVGTNGELWLGYYGSGLVRMNRKTLDFEVFTHQESNPYSLINDYVSKLYLDKEGTLWVGTYNGISYFNPDLYRFRLYQNVPNSFESTNNSVYGLYETQEGWLWSGTLNGAYALNRKTGERKHIYEEFSSEEVMNGGEIFGFYEDGNILWMLNSKGYAYAYDKESESIQVHDVAGGTHSAIYQMMRTADGRVWLGSASGLGRWDIQTGKLIYRYNNPHPDSLSSSQIRYMLEGNDGYLWLATRGGGLNRFDRKKNTFKHYMHNPADTSSISSDRTYCLYEEGDFLWIATSNGLNRFNKKTEKFRSFDEKNGLANNFIYAILADEAGNLWLSHNEGISRFNPRTEKFQNYDVKDGLQGNEYNSGAFFRQKNGEMFLGGVNGVNAFFPKEIQADSSLFSIEFSSFKIRNEEQELPLAINHSSEVFLNYNDYSFSFEFAALSFLTPEKVEYAYKLEPFDQDWVYTQRRFAGYTNLDPGEYTLYVKAANRDGVWTEPKQMKLHIKPAFWQTKAFMIIVALVVLLIMALVFRARAKQLELQRKKEVAELAAKYRTQFLVNMSHEIRTPMNAVVGMTHLLQNTPLSTKQSEYLNTIQQSSQNLLVIINDILDYSKMDAGKITISPQTFPLQSILEHIQQTLAYKAQENRTEIILEHDSSIPNYLIGDPTRLNQIILNLGGNAVKFTTDGQVYIRSKLMKEEDDRLWVQFEVEDTGIGISANKLDTIFETFEQADDSISTHYGGTGLGLAISKRLLEYQGGEITVESTLGKGTVFRFGLPFELGDENMVVKEDEEALQAVGKGRILLVDDFAVNRQVAVEILGEMMPNVEVETAENGQQVLDILQQNPAFDLILMDVKMPVMNGLRCTERIRQEFHEPLRSIPIVALTASVTEDEIKACIDAGMNDLIPKPFHPKKLYKKVATFLPSLDEEETPSIQENESKNVAPSTAPPSDAMINRAYLLEMMGGNEQFVERFLIHFWRELPNWQAAVRLAIQEQKHEALESAAHHLKTQVRYVGWEKMGDDLQRLETLAAQKAAWEEIGEWGMS